MAEKMATTKRLTIENVDLDSAPELDALFDQVIGVGMSAVRANIARLQAEGIMDSHGHLISKELPPDMREGSPRDFGA
jgi:hypothetical protein